MAYFSNGNEAATFDNQCGRCKHGQNPCPIAFVQQEYNYDAVNNEVATKILGELVKDDGTCTMFEMCKSDFQIDPNQVKIQFPS